MLEAFGDHFMRIALAAGVIVSVVCAYLGVYVVLRRVVFVGAALAQLSAAGIGFAILTGANPSAMSLLATIGGVAAFSAISGREFARESLIGVGYAAGAAFGVLFLAKSAQGEAHLLDVLSGNILTVTPSEIVWMLAVAVVALALHALFRKQLVFSAFDPETARASGFRTKRWDLLFFIMLAVVISFAIRLVGALLVFAMLVIPPVTGMLLGRRLSAMSALSVVSSLIATVVGLYASFRLDLPSGPTIVAVSIALLATAWIWQTGASSLRRTLSRFAARPNGK